MERSKMALLLGSWLLLACLTAPAYAIFGIGDIVFNPQAFQQQMTDYYLQIDQYSTQMRQYSTQMQQLQADYANLRSLGYRADLSSLDRAQQTMNNAGGISNDFAKMQRQFQELYPDFNRYHGQKGADYARQSVEWSRKNQQNAYDMLVLQSRLQESMAQDQANLKYLNSRSDSASGTKDLLQAMNQILIMNTKQLMQLQQIMTTAYKADAAYMAQQSANEEASRAASDNIYRDWTKKGARTPLPKPGHVLQ